MITFQNNSFDDISNTYNYRIPYHVDFINLLKEKLKIEKNMTLMDIGCGDGCLTIDMLDSGAKILGVDISEKMIEQAKKHANRDFKILDLNALDAHKEIYPNYFDHYLLGHSIHWINTDPLEKLITQGLKNGGTVTTCGNNWDLKSNLAVAYHRLTEKYKSFDNHDVTGQEKMKSIGFSLTEIITFRYQFSVDLNFLVNQSLSYARFREKILVNFDKFYLDLATAMKPFMNDGVITGTALNWGCVYKRIDNSYETEGVNNFV